MKTTLTLKIHLSRWELLPLKWEYHAPDNFIWDVKVSKIIKDKEYSWLCFSILYKKYS